MSIKRCFQKLSTVNKLLYLSKYKMTPPTSQKFLGRYLHKTCCISVCNYKVTTCFSYDEFLLMFG